MKAFDEAGIPYRAVVEPQEADEYARYIPRDRLVVTPHRDEGVTVTRNFIWDLAAEEGHDRYWSFDDNIGGLFRFHYNLKTPMADGTALAVIEDFVERYNNVPIAGMNYFMFASRKVGNQPAFYLNTRVYSNMLIETDVRYPDTGKPVRFVTFFNEDTDICLRVLKAGYCTFLVNAFLIDKAHTMTMKGGNTEYYEATERRKEFVEELRREHPDLVELTEKWGRWHHHVDYSGFRQQPVLREGVEIPDGNNEYGLVLQERTTEGEWRTIEDPSTWDQER